MRDALLGGGDAGGQRLRWVRDAGALRGAAGLRAARLGAAFVAADLVADFTEGLRARAGALVPLALIGVSVAVAMENSLETGRITFGDSTDRPPLLFRTPA